MFGEDLATAEAAGPWPTTFPAARYCRAHWLMARPTSEVDAPEGVDLEGRSAWITGTWERGGAAEAFEIDTWWPHGRLDAMSDVVDPEALAAARADKGAWVARVTVARSLGGLFDGIELAEASPEEIAGSVLSNLAEKAEIRVELWRPEGG
jgi:hypothetical protein